MRGGTERRGRAVERQGGGAYFRGGLKDESSGDPGEGESPKMTRAELEDWSVGDSESRPPHLECDSGY